MKFLPILMLSVVPAYAANKCRIVPARIVGQQASHLHT